MLEDLETQVGPAEDQIAAQVLHLMSRLQPMHAPERRCSVRQAYPFPIHLTPHFESDGIDLDESFVVIGKQLSEHGLDFYHQRPLTQRRVIASFHVVDTKWIAMLLDLRWNRFGSHGWYQSGGRFVRAITSPLDGNETWSLMAF